MREIVNAIFYVLRGGVRWRMLPPCFLPRQTVYDWFAAWRDSGVWQAITHRLLMLDRELSGRRASDMRTLTTAGLAAVRRPSGRNGAFE